MYLIREPQPQDMNFIIDSWSQSYLNFKKQIKNGEEKKAAQEPLKFIRRSVYFKGQKKVIQGILPASRILIACNPDDINHLYGYIIYQKPNVLHYIYVSHVWRKMGIGTALVDTSELNRPIEYTHHTDNMRYLGPVWTCEYNPYILLK